MSAATIAPQQQAPVPLSQLLPHGISTTTWGSTPSQLLPPGLAGTAVPGIKRSASPLPQARPVGGGGGGNGLPSGGAPLNLEAFLQTRSEESLLRGARGALPVAERSPSKTDEPPPRLPPGALSGPRATTPPAEEGATATTATTNPTSPQKSSPSKAAAPLVSSGASLFKVKKVPSAVRDPCSPSVGPTPRDREFGGFIGLRSSGAVLLAPSAGLGNDAARSRNGGRPLGWLQQQRPAAQRRSPSSPQDSPETCSNFMRVSSAPVLSNHEPKTPRGARGMVRKVSKVVLDMPLSPPPGSRKVDPNATWHAGTKDTDSPEGGRARSPNSEAARLARTTAGGAFRSSSPTKRVRFADEEWTWSPDSPTGKIYSSKSREDGTPTTSLQRSVRKMDALYDLRRAAKEEPPADGTPAVARDVPPAQAAAAAGQRTRSQHIPPPPDPQDEEEETALMYTLLRDLTDTSEDLFKLTGGMTKGLKDASDNGGARHATAVVSGRALSVAKRKAQLLYEIEERTKAFEEAHARREELLPKIVAGTEKAPEALGGIRKFISSYVHVGGHPADAPKTFFEQFAKTFKLPRNHGKLMLLKETAAEAANFWAESCLSEAEKGHGHKEIRRLFNIAVGTGVDEDHPKLLRALQILNDRLATRVLKDAQELETRDTRAEKSNRPPGPGPANSLADRIEQDIFNAIEEGVPEKDPRIQQAKEICKNLRQKDGERKRMAARDQRMAAAKAKAAP